MNTIEKQLREYLLQLNLGKPIADRVIGFFHQCQLLSDNSIEDLFISQTMNRDGTQAYSNLVFCSKTTLYEVNAFVSNATIEMVRWCNVFFAQYAPTMFSPDDAVSNPSTGATVVATIVWQDNRYNLRLHATGANCKNLYAILKQYVVPHLR
jgi:hypothetical protein